MKIELTEVMRENGMVHFRVLCEPRPGWGWERVYRNGIRLMSRFYPAWSDAKKTLFLTGTHAGNDDFVCCATEFDFARIQSAVAESNAMDGHVEPKEVTLEDQIAELERRVAALESADDPVQDDAGNGDEINVGATPVDLSLPEPEPKADEAEPKRFFANLYANGFVSMHQSLQSANYNRAAGFDKCLELVEAAAYDRLKAENARLKSQRDEMVEAADIAIRSLAIAQTERDELQKQLAQSAIEYSGLVGELTAVAAERDRLKSQMLRFSEGKNISNPVWYAKNCLLADADLKQQLATPVDLSPPDSHEPKRWFVNLYAVAYDRLKAERDVLREFAEAVAEGKVDEWNKRHEVKGLSWYASAKGCLLAADAAKQGK